ncbi:MAG: STAS domain-containing protein [Spirochaetales bacterium]|nr:STAS domain-containing protein [Spirochaetales bacterium]
MEIKKRIEGNCVIVDMEGEMDYLNAVSLRQVIMELIDAKKKNIIINLEKVPYMDSTGLGTLITLWQKSKAQAIGLKYAHPQETVKKLFVLSRLNNILPITATLQEAIEQLQ